MIKLVCFDLDDTLAKANAPVDESVVEALKEIESHGIRILLVSGKPVSYVCGLARQLGLRRPIISGENGALIYYSYKFPPEKQISLASDTGKQADVLFRLGECVFKKFDDKVWIQPNLLNLTIFPRLEEGIEELLYFLKSQTKLIDNFDKEFKVYEHADSVEIVPRSVNKGAALRKILELEKINRKDTIAVGDSENDLSMLLEAGVSIGINLDGVGFKVANINEAMKIIRERI
jgi:HAD superfamily hydrolase (TIGR01484 family)